MLSHTPIVKKERNFEPGHYITMEADEDPVGYDKLDRETCYIVKDHDPLGEESCSKPPGGENLVSKLSSYQTPYGNVV